MSPELSLSPSVRGKLSAMMFLEFFVWGAWFVTMGTYLGQGLRFDGVQVAAAYSTMPWGTIVAPFFVGMIADRFFAAERVLGVMHLLGAGLLLLASRASRRRASSSGCCSPTPSATARRSRSSTRSRSTRWRARRSSFRRIRVFGTIGWIVAGLIVGTHGCRSDRDPAADRARSPRSPWACSPSALPHTPPKSLGHKVSVRDVLGLDALVLMKDRSFLIFVLGSLLICVPLAFYYGFTNLFLNEKGIVNAAGKMSMGQMSEVAFMLLMPLFFRRLGVKWMLVVGMAAWAVRYLFFAYGNPSELVALYYLGILLHGICYDFFFVTGQIYVDNTAPKKIQASAQGFITLVTYGVGMLIGTCISGLVVKGYQLAADDPAAGHDWTSIWLVPAGMAFVVILLFIALFDGKGMGTQA